ncbi:uncharacterized protein [Oryctolagus cuniculus]|uniref:uncharacterized protein n=1 Tax=Oryctolagus cuniculus TaxID=9986 RepID=UPI0038790E3C
MASREPKGRPPARGPPGDVEPPQHLNQRRRRPPASAPPRSRPGPARTRSPDPESRGLSSARTAVARPSAAFRLGPQLRARPVKPSGPPRSRPRPAPRRCLPGLLSPIPPRPRPQNGPRARPQHPDSAPTPSRPRQRRPGSPTTPPRSPSWALPQEDSAPSQLSARPQPNCALRDALGPAPSTLLSSAPPPNATPRPIANWPRPQTSVLPSSLDLGSWPASPRRDQPAWALPPADLPDPEPGLSSRQGWGLWACRATALGLGMASSRLDLGGQWQPRTVSPQPSHWQAGSSASHTGTWHWRHTTRKKEVLRGPQIQLPQN